MAKRKKYKNYQDDYAGYTSHMDDSGDYNQYTSEFKYTPATNLDVLTQKNQITGQTNEGMYSDALNRAYMMHADLSENRSVLDRTLNALMVFNHAGAGFAKGLVDGDGKGTVSPLQGFVQGLRASNPFGDGYHQGEYNYSQVLGAAGWNPTSLGGRVAKGTLGFVGDVLLDPTTYLSGGSSALIKGTGAHAVEGVARAAGEQLAAKEGIKFRGAGELGNDIFDSVLKRTMDNGVNPDLATRFAAKKMNDANQVMSDVMKPMVESRAREIIIKNNLLSGTVISEEQLAKDTQNLTNQFNKIIGHQKPGEGMTFGLGNLPFGEKLFGKPGTIISDTALRQVGDATFGKLYAASRNSFYGSKLGEMFSTSTPLFRLSQNNPAGLYDFIKHVDYTKGQNLNKSEEEAAIRKRAKDFNLTPAENKAVLDLLQNPSIWNKVKQVFKVADTEEYAALHTELGAKRAATQSQLDELRNMRDQVNSTLASKEGDAAAASDAHDALHREYVRKLINFDAGFAGDKQAVIEHQNMIKEELNKIDAAHAANDVTPESIVAKHELFTAAQKEIQAGTRTAGAEDIHRGLIDDLNKHIFGGGDTIAHSAMKPVVDKIIHMIKNGDHPDMIKAHIEKQPLLYGEKAVHIYPFIAEVFGYGSGYKDKTWKEMFHDKVEKLTKGAVNGQLKNMERDAIDNLVKMSEERKLMIQHLQKMSTPEILDYIKKYKEENFMGSIRSLDDEFLQASRERFTDDSGAMRNFEKKLAKNTITPDELRQYESMRMKNDAIFTNLTVGDKAKARLEIADLLQNRMNIKSDDFNKLGWTTFANNPNKYVHSFVKQKETSWTIVEDGIELDKFTSKQAAENALKNYNESNQVAGRRINAKIKNTSPWAIMDNTRQVVKQEFDSEVSAKKGLYNFIQSSKRKQSLLPAAQEQVLSSVVDELPRILKDIFGKEIQDLTPKELYKAYGYAIHEAFKKNNYYGYADRLAEEKVAKIAETGKKIVQDNTPIGSKILFPHEGKVVGGHVQSIATTSDGKLFSVKLKSGEVVDGIKPSEILNSVPPKQVIQKDVVLQRASLLADLSKYDKQLEEMDAGYKSGRSALIEGYKKQLLQTDEIMKDLNMQTDILKETLYTGDLAKIDQMEMHIKHMDEALSNTEAFDTYTRLIMGDERVDAILAAHAAKTPVQIMLDVDMSVDDKVKDIVKLLRGHFDQMGEKEVQIGKLQQGQLDEMLGMYVPHILTPEGKAFFDKDITIKKPSITQDIGYGLKYNPYAKSRSIRELEINGELIKNPTISQINEYFSQFLGGKNAFQENIADIYLTRALKNTELMYDNEYMNNMMNVFGREIKKDIPIKEGFKAVVNVGKIRESIYARASMLTSAQMSEMAKMRSAQGFGFQKMSGDEVRAIYEANLTKSMEQHGMTSELIDSLATPMIELNQEQITKLHAIGHKSMRQVNDAIVNKANQARKLQIAKDQNSFLKMYDKFTHLLKLNMTTITPAFHARNKLSNMYLNWLAIGKEAFNVKTQIQMTRLIRNRGVIEDSTMFSMHHADGTVSSMTWQELYHQAAAHGVIDEGFFAKDIGAGASTKGILKKFVPAKFDPTDSENFLPYRVGGKIGNVIENTDRLTHFATLLKRGVPMDEAAASVTKHLFDYSDLTGFEQSVMKRIFPFYTWLRKNGALQVSTLIDNPGKFQYVAKALSGIEGMSNTDEQLNPAFVSDYAKDMVLTPFRKSLSTRINPDGSKTTSTEPIMWNPNLPFNDLSRLPNPFNIKDTIKNLFTQGNPLLKVPTEQVMNKNVFFDRPIVEDGGNQITSRVNHVLSTNAGYNVLKSLSGKDDEDTMLNLLSAGTGIKLSAYDYRGNMGMVLQKAVEKAKIDIARWQDKQDKMVSLAPADQIHSPMYAPPSPNDAKRYITQGAILSGFIGKPVQWGMVAADALPHGGKFKIGKVLKVDDGDTMIVDINGKKATVRFLLIDTPETVDPRLPVMPFGHEASDYTKSRLKPGNDVQLYFDTETLDVHGRMVAYVESNGEDINNTLLSKGLAKTRYIYDGNTSRYEKYRETEKIAKLNKLGIWSIPDYADSSSDKGYHLGVVDEELMNKLNPKK